MADSSSIEWTDATWNPVTGCSKVSPGCAHCYAEALTMRHAKSWGVPGLPWTPANAAENVILKPERLEVPLRWRRPRMVFVNSMSDLFHEQVPDEFIWQVWNVMASAERHTFQVLTKRPERMAAMLSGTAVCEHGWRTHNGDNPSSYGGTGILVAANLEWPLPNVWVGTSIENRRYVGRADALRATPAAVRFISAEPLLGPLVAAEEADYALDLGRIDQLIVGGESGPGHRLMKPEWVRLLRDAAKEAGTAFFFKQWGGRTPKAGGRELDGRMWDEMPARAREAVAA